MVSTTDFFLYLFFFFFFAAFDFYFSQHFFSQAVAEEAPVRELWVALRHNMEIMLGKHCCKTQAVDNSVVER